jgi:hypothetical protein
MPAIKPPAARVRKMRMTEICLLANEWPAGRQLVWDGCQVHRTRSPPT